MPSALPKYQQLAERTERFLQATAQPGDRLLSIRDFASREHVSISTAQRVYEELELRGLIESRPRSGYYFNSPPSFCPQTLPLASREITLPHNRKEWVEWLDNQGSKEWQVQRYSAFFATGQPDSSMAGVQTLNRILRRLTRNNNTDYLEYGPLLGDVTLREQLVHRAAQAGVVAEPDQQLVTCGGQEALYLAINASTQPGDLIAVESPAYHGVIGTIEQSGRKLIEIPTDPITGINLAALELALDNLTVRAVVVSTAAQNPLGFTMSDEHREALVTLANNRDIVLIEDDVHGELCFARNRTRSLRAFDTQDRVATCSSTSKTLAPGLRIGWLNAARWHDKAIEIKRVSSLRTSLLNQQAVALHMAEGHYDRHVRLARSAYALRCSAMRTAILKHFPAGTRVSQPTGGFLLWIELPDNISGTDLAEYALSRDIALSPGCLFSTRNHYGHCIRLCFSRYNSKAQAESLQLLGQWLGR